MTSQNVSALRIFIEQRSKCFKARSWENVFSWTSLISLESIVLPRLQQHTHPLMFLLMSTPRKRKEKVLRHLNCFWTGAAVRKRYLWYDCREIPDHCRSTVNVLFSSDHLNPLCCIETCFCCFYYILTNLLCIHNHIILLLFYYMNLRHIRPHIFK